MAPRSFWKGHLKLSLVTCAVTMMPARTDGENVHFHVLNAATGNRVVSRYLDAVTGRPVREEDEAKGYPRGEDEHVVIEDDELDSIALESTRVIDVEMFVPADSIRWIWFDTPHYLAPGDKVGEEAFSVIRSAMAATDTVGIARLVLYRRERAVMLQPRGRGIVLWTLRYGDEVRRGDEAFAKVGEDQPEGGLMRLMKQLIDGRTQDWSPDMASDPVQARLKEIIAAKRKKRKAPAKREAAAGRPDNVVNIMDALKKSLAAEKRK